MTNEATFLNTKMINRSVLASGILGLTLASLKKAHREGAGLVTTKSIGLEGRKGHKAPVVYVFRNGLINAVGLSNPGIEKFISQLKNEYIDFPLVVSIFGKTEDDFPLIAEMLHPLDYTFLELNVSCPNVLDEFGTPFSFSQELVYRITRKVKDKTKRPVIVKLSPNTPILLRVAKSAEEAGADALCIMNTVGPGMVIDTSTGFPILGNKTGGVSGDAILPITVRNVYEAYRKISIPIIGTGGISDADGALQVLMAGASLYGIGSAVYTKGLRVFRDIERGIDNFLINNRFESIEEIIGLSHKKNVVSFYNLPKNLIKVRRLRDDHFFITRPVKDIAFERGSNLKTLFFEFDDEPLPRPGQFYMLWIPGVDQKPYSVSYCDKGILGFTVLKKGPFSGSLFDACIGDPVGLLGPLGKGFNLQQDNYILAGGGIGLAPLMYATMELKKLNKIFYIIAGGKTESGVHWIDLHFESLKEDAGIPVYYCTEDGSLGEKGKVSDYLKHFIEKLKPEYALACGPEAYLKNAISIFMGFGISGEAAIERVMKCGIGLCGSCSVDKTGDRVCVEGPVFSFEYLKDLYEFGRYKRDASGAIEELE